MKRLLAIAAIVLACTGAALAEDDRETYAYNHGYATAALEVYCKGMMTVTNPKTRAKIDSLYRDNKRWKKYFLEGYEFVAGKNVSPWGQLSVCTRAADALIGGKEGNASEWLELDPKARETLKIDLKNENERRFGR